MADDVARAKIMKIEKTKENAYKYINIYKRCVFVASVFLCTFVAYVCVLVCVCHGVRACVIMCVCVCQFVVRSLLAQGDTGTIKYVWRLACAIVAFVYMALDG